jgi:hypothetical protein
MNHDYEQQLEAAIDRELKGLGELPAPATLVSRIMRVVEQRAARPWYRRAWQAWPVAWQAASLTALLVVFGAVCFGVAGVFQAASASAPAHQVGGWLASIGAVIKTLGVLAEAAVLAVRHLGMVVLIGCLVGLALAYAACLGLGTAWMRLALARR